MVTARVSRSLEALDLWVPGPRSEKATTQSRAPRQLGLASEVYAGEKGKRKGGGALPFFATTINDFCQPGCNTIIERAKRKSRSRKPRGVRAVQLSLSSS